MSAGKLPEGWVSTSIENISVKCSQRVPAENKEFIYVDIGSINRELKFIETPQYLSGKNAPSRARKVIKAGDVIVSLTRPNLNAVALVDEKYDNQIASTGFEVIHPVQVESKYIFGLVRSRHFIDSISGLVQGALYPAAKSSDVQSYEFPLPPLAEQKIIAEKLDTLLAQVGSTKARLEQIPQILKRFRQAILATAMNGKLTEDWKKDNPSLFTKWNKSNIGELAQVATGKTPKRTDDRYWENGTIPWLTSSSTGKIFVENADQFISDIALRECTLKIFSPGTLLLAMYGEGKTRGQVTELKISATCNQACAAIICDEDKINRQFLKMRLMENYQETRKVAAGGNQPNLNLNKVREIPILLPSLPEQHEIVRRVEQLFAYADTIEKQVNNALARVNNLTQSILAKAFRGELTAQWRAENPELISGENSAAALLEKIKAERAASWGKKASRKKS